VTNLAENRVEWSADLVAEVQRLWNKGYSALNIAMAHGMTRNAVIGKVSRLRMADPDNWRRGGNAQTAWVPVDHVPIRVGSPGTWTPANVETLRELLSKGRTHRQIGEAMGRGRGSICAKVKALGWANGGNREARSTPEAAPAPSVKSILPPLRFVRPLAETSIGDRINRIAGLQEARGEPYHWRSIQPLANANTPPVNLFERTGCCFPVGHNGHLTTFCNVATDGTYCEHHQARMIRPR
jgi:hypothetical protein